MTKINQIYKCNICGNMIEIIHAAAGKLMCCGQEMSLLDENTRDASKEKHVPVIEYKDGGTLVRVGSLPHPMEEKHYIEWIEAISGNTVIRKMLKPGDQPEAFFKCALENASVRELCNLHGLWKA